MLYVPSNCTENINSESYETLGHGRSRVTSLIHLGFVVAEIIRFYNLDIHYETSCIYLYKYQHFILRFNKVHCHMFYRNDIDIGEVT
jgi:hypothetical protein